MQYDVRRFGARGDGMTRDTQALQSAIDTCGAAGGGQVILTAGTYLCGTIELQNNVDLHLSQDAILLGSADPSDYTKQYNAPYDNGFPSEGTQGHHLVTAWQKRNISLSGKGVIDGNGPVFFGAAKPSPIKASVWDREGRWRTSQMIGLVECEAVRIEGLTFQNSPFWTIWPYACRDVTISGIKIRNDWKTPNGDGLDIDCCANVLISNCDIAAGDDAIALRADRLYSGLKRDLENVVIRDCILNSPLGGLRFGPSGEGSRISDVTVTNCAITADAAVLFTSTPYTDYWRKGLLVENIDISHLSINAQAPLVMVESCGNPASGFRNIRISHMRGKSFGGCYLAGSGSGVFEDIRLADISYEIEKLQSFKCQGSLAQSAFSAKNVKGLSMRNFIIDASQCAAGDLGNAVHFAGVDGLELSRLEALPRPGRLERLICQNVLQLNMHDCHGFVESPA